MAQHWEEHWRFTTANLAVVFEVAPCTDDPRDSFEFAEDIEAVNSGAVVWFDARVRVLLVDKYGNDAEEVGADYLGSCAYNSVREFITGHRDADPMNRNSSLMRATRGENTSICHYFPGMVREACSAARARVEHIRGLALRAVA